MEGPAVPIHATGGSGELWCESPGRHGNAACHHRRQWRAAMGNTGEEESMQPAGSEGSAEVLGDRP